MRLPLTPLASLLACLALLASGVTASAQAQVPALQAGTRVTFYSSSASVRGTTQQAVFKPNCDPSKEQCWTDPNGRTIGLEDVPTASGQGFTQLDVLYLDQQTCVLRLTSYTLEPGTNAVRTAASGGLVTTGGACADYWLSPASLQQLPVQDSGGFRVLRGPYTLGSLTFEAVSIGNFAAGASSHNSYDAASGLLMVASSRTQGAAVPTISPGNVVVAGAGSALLTFTQWLHSRLLQLSGILERLPDHAQGTTRLVYACSQGTGMPGIGSVQLPCAFEVALGQRNELWVHATSRLQTTDGITTVPTVTEAEHVIAASGHGGHLASPTWLAGLQSGVRLDVDAVTGVAAYVESVDANAVSIVEQSNAEFKRFVYDRGSGWLLHYGLEQSSGLGSFTQTFDLIGVQ